MQRLTDFNLLGIEPAAIRAEIGFVGDHPLREQALERLLHADLSHPLQRSGPEAGVEQVQDRMLDAADVLADGEPFLGFDTIERRAFGLAGEADKVPT